MASTATKGHTVADKIEILDAVIARLEKQLRELNARHNELMDLMVSDPATIDSTGKNSPGAELMSNRSQAAGLEQQLTSFRNRRAEAEEEAQQRAQFEQRARFRAETVAKADSVRAKAKKRVQLGKKLDEHLQAFGAILRELETLNGEMGRDAANVVQVAYMGAPHASHRISDAIGHAQAGITTAGGDALVHMLLHNGVGRTGIAAPMLFGNLSTIHPQSIAAAFESSATRTETLLAGWLYQAFGPDEAQPDEVVRVRATEDGFDNLCMRLKGEVFDFQLRGGHELPRWVKRAPDAEISVPDRPPELTIEDVRAMNPGMKVRALDPAKPSAAFEASASVPSPTRRAGGAR